VLDYAVQVFGLCYTLYCAFYSILFGGGAFFPGHGVGYWGQRICVPN